MRSTDACDSGAWDFRRMRNITLLSSIAVRSLTTLVLAWSVAACTNAVDVVEPGADDDDVAVLYEGDPADFIDADGNGPVNAAAIDFVRLGVRFTSRDSRALELRTSTDGQTWSAWQKPQLVFSEGDVHAGHIDVDGAANAAFFQHRVVDDREPPTFLSLEPIGAVGTAPVDDGEIAAASAVQSAEASTAEEGLNVDI